MNYITPPLTQYYLDIITRGGKPDEDDLIDHVLHNQPPTPIHIDELMKGFESNPWANLCPTYSIPDHVKTIKFGSYKNLNINPSRLGKHEEKLCKVLRKHLDAFLGTIRK